MPYGHLLARVSRYEPIISTLLRVNFFSQKVKALKKKKPTTQRGKETKNPSQKKPKN